MQQPREQAPGPVCPRQAGPRIRRFLPWLLVSSFPTKRRTTAKTSAHQKLFIPPPPSIETSHTPVGFLRHMGGAQWGGLTRKLGAGREERERERERRCLRKPKGSARRSSFLLTPECATFFLSVCFHGGMWFLACTLGGHRPLSTSAFGCYVASPPQDAESALLRECYGSLQVEKKMGVNFHHIGVGMMKQVNGKNKKKEKNKSEQRMRDFSRWSSHV